MEKNSSCGGQYTYRIKPYTNMPEMSDPVNINWFECRQNKKCVHMDTRCDMHPNPACIYWKDGRKRVAEDEEDSIEEYRVSNMSWPIQ